MELLNCFKGAKWIQIRYSSKGAYFIKRNTRYYLSEFMKHGNYGYLPLCNFGGMAIRVDENGEAVKVGYQFS